MKNMCLPILVYLLLFNCRLQSPKSGVEVLQRSHDLQIYWFEFLFLDSLIRYDSLLTIGIQLWEDSPS